MILFMFSGYGCQLVAMFNNTYTFNMAVHIHRQSGTLCAPLQIEIVERAPDLVKSLFRNMSINFRGFTRIVTKQRLNIAQISSLFKQMSGNTMP